MAKQSRFGRLSIHSANGGATAAGMGVARGVRDVVQALRSWSGEEELPGNKPPTTASRTTARMVSQQSRVRLCLLSKVSFALSPKKAEHTDGSRAKNTFLKSSTKIKYLIKTLYKHTYLSICLYFYLSIYLSTYLSI